MRWRRLREAAEATPVIAAPPSPAPEGKSRGNNIKGKHLTARPPQHNDPQTQPPPPQPIHFPLASPGHTLLPATMGFGSCLFIFVSLKIISNGGLRGVEEWSKNVERGGDRESRPRKPAALFIHFV